MTARTPGEITPEQRAQEALTTMFAEQAALARTLPGHARAGFSCAAITATIQAAEADARDRETARCMEWVKSYMSPGPALLECLEKLSKGE